MRLAVRTHGARWIVPFELIVAIIGSLFGQVSLYIPAFSGTGAVPVTVVAALAGTTLLAYPLTAAWPRSRTTPVRSPALVATGALVVLVGPALALSVGVGLVDAATTAFAYVGTLAWLLALQLALGTLVSATYQAMAPTVYVLICALLGRTDSSVQPWAWPLADIPGWAALAVGSIALAAAWTVFAALGFHGESD